MTNLSQRVEKAKLLRITKTNGYYNTWGSQDDLYKVKLSSNEKEIITPDGYLAVKLFNTKCEKCLRSEDLLDCDWENCIGNSRHTVCYHSLGAIWKSFKDVGSQVSFYSTFRDADRGLTFGGFLAKIENNNGKGFVWCVVRKSAGTPEVREINLLPKGLDVGREPEIIEVKVASESEVVQSLKQIESVAKQITDKATKNINLMRGNENDEGID